MAGIVGDIGGFFKISKKERHDSWTDQFNRILVVKALLAATLLLGINWYGSEIDCIIPGTAGIDGGYVSQACWINGMYVYKDLKHISQFKGYYAIPVSLQDDGILAQPNNDNTYPTCSTSDRSKENCKKMEKIFYLQFQWFPFYIALIGVLFYLPYLVFLRVNSDIISLGKSLTAFNKDDVLNNYFDDKVNSPYFQNMAALLNIFVKVLYLISNILAFVFTDTLLNGDFKAYGLKWFNWVGLPNFDMNNYVGVRDQLKPGEVLLPTFLLCDVLELSKDIKNTLFNEHRFVCEVKSHVLYQYVLAMIWLIFILGMTISIIGIIQCIVKFFSNTFSFLPVNAHEKHIYKHLSPRQKEYLDYINKKDVSAYKSVVRELHQKFAQQDKDGDEHFLMS